KKISADDRAKIERGLVGARKTSDEMFADLSRGGMPKGGLNNDPKKLVKLVAVTAIVGQLEHELANYDSEGNQRLLAIGVQDLPTRDNLQPRGAPRNLQDVVAGYNARPAEFAAIGDSALFIRGDVSKPGEKVPRGFIGIASGPQAPSI